MASRLNIRFATVLLIGTLLLPAQWVHPDPATQGATKDAEPATAYSVLPRDTLWDLAQRFLSDPYRWHEIWRANAALRNPDLIFPGQLLWLPHDPNATDVSAALQSLVTPDVGPGLTGAPTQEAGLASGGFRALLPIESASGSSVIPDNGYVDRLIDPSKPEDNFSDYALQADKGTSLLGLGGIDHAIDLLALYRDDNTSGRNPLDQGLHYIARLNTRNWGQLRLNLIALDEFNFTTSNFSNGAASNSDALANNFRARKARNGIVRASLEQYNLPIAEDVWLDNIIGTHRQVRYNPFRERPNLINYRFGAAEPDILGISSHLKFGHNGVSLSAGKLGQTSGSLLPGFVRTEGSVQRAQWTHVRDRQAISGEVWRTNNQTLLDNRVGYRIGLDHLLSPTTAVSLSAVRSGSSQAFLAGGSTQSEERKHDYGLYFFDPDLLWLDTRIGDDNAGGFYRFSSRRGFRTFGGSLELRRDGVSNAAPLERDTAFLSVSYAHRLNRRSTLSSFYSYRHAENKTQAGTSVQRDHAIRSYYSRTHRSGASSQLGAILRARTGTDEATFTYGFSKSLANDSSVEFEARQRTSIGQSSSLRETTLNTNWNRQFYNGGYLGLGIGYTWGKSSLDDNSGLTGYLNFDQPLTSALNLSLQLDYSQNRTENEQNLTDTFFTDSAFDIDDFNTFREFTALMRLSYRLGGRNSNAPLSGGNGLRGSGRVRGVLFIDVNGDGVRQANEQGLAGVTVFLNSIYPVLTNSRGEYNFASVGPGDHFLFIDETTLPLPWSLAGSEYTPLRVELRRTTRTDIAVSPIIVAEAGE